MTFNRLVLPTGASLPIAASVVGIAINRRSQMKVDSEGNLSGGKPGKKQLVDDLGMSFAVSKVADDGCQLAAEALISTATDASTAGTARLVGWFAGVVRLVQSGLIYWYAFMMIFGVCAVYALVKYRVFAG